MSRSPVEELAAAGPEAMAVALAGMGDDELAAWWKDWRTHARPEQLAEDGAWRWWLVLTGRGFGKTRCGAEWVVDRCELFARHNWPHLVALMNKTNDDVRDIQIRGESGLAAVCERRGHKLNHTGSALHATLEIRRPDGTVHVSAIEVHTGMDPDKARGRNLHTLWADELAAWKQKLDSMGNTAFTNADFSLRAECPPGEEPRGIVTTTPKPITVIRDLVKGNHGSTSVTRGSLRDNAANLPPAFVAAIYRRYHGSRLGSQEIDGAILDAVEGALWTPDLIEQYRVRPGIDPVPELATVVVGVDPSGSEGGDECGIIVVGLARQRDALGRPHLYVLEDGSVQNRPAVWAPHVLDLVDKWGGDMVVAETNFGGLLVVDTLQLRRQGLPVERVTATRGKRIRAEPVATIYDTGQVHHVGYLELLEEQQATWTPLEPTSPDRLDALVWAVTWLIPDLATAPADFAVGLADIQI